MQKHVNSYVFIILICAIVIDVMGFGLVFPLFPQLFLIKDCVFKSSSSPLSCLFYGLAFSIWNLGNFFGTPYLGLLSDKYGRKKILTFCLFMTSLSYLLSAFSIYTHNLFLFLFSRAGTGFFGGSYDIAQAGIADISSHKNKARNMGLIAFAFAFGIIIGPTIAGITTNSNFIAFFGIGIPFFIAAFLSLINSFFILMFFKETFSGDRSIKIGGVKVFTSFLFVFKDNRVFALGLSFLFFLFAWSGYISSLPLILGRIFNLSIQKTSFVFLLMGAGIAFSIILLQNKINKIWKLKESVLIFVVLLTVLSVLFAVFQKCLFFEYTFAVMFGVCFLPAYSGLLALGSNAVKENEQGKIMGGLGAIASIAFFISGIIASQLASYNTRLPIFISIISFLITLFILHAIRKK